MEKLTFDCLYCRHGFSVEVDSEWVCPGCGARPIFDQVEKAHEHAVEPVDNWARFNEAIMDGSASVFKPDEVRFDPRDPPPDRFCKVDGKKIAAPGSDLCRYHGGGGLKNWRT